MYQRLIPALATASLLVAGFWYLHSLTTCPLIKRQMSRPATLDDLQVKLEQTASQPPTVLVTVSNKHPSSALTVLTWDTPLDEKALSHGVFHLTDNDTGKRISGPSIKVNRVLPSPADALVEIGPDADVTREVRLEARWIPTDGKDYCVQASGFWKAVWPRRKAELSENELKTMNGSDVMNGDYSSDQIRIQMPKTEV